MSLDNEYEQISTNIKEEINDIINRLNTFNVDIIEKHNQIDPVLNRLNLNIKDQQEFDTYKTLIDKLNDEINTINENPPVPPIVVPVIIANPRAFGPVIPPPGIAYELYRGSPEYLQTSITAIRNWLNEYDFKDNPNNMIQNIIDNNQLNKFNMYFHVFLCIFMDFYVFV